MFETIVITACAVTILLAVFFIFCRSETAKMYVGLLIASMLIVWFLWSIPIFFAGMVEMIGGYILLAWVYLIDMDYGGNGKRVRLIGYISIIIGIATSVIWVSRL